MALAPVVALEIGTAKTVALVGESRDDGTTMITGIGEHPTTGVRKGEITDLESALICVRAALQAAEDNAQVTIREVHLALSGGHIQSVVNRGSAPVIDPAGEITEEDVQHVMNIARAVNLPPDREILHTICQHFHIDDQEKVVRPEGLEGAKLAVDMLALYGVRSRMRNTVKVVRTVPMEVQDVAFSGLCSALAVLTPEHKESGVLLIDLGAGTTDYVAYAADTVAAAGAIGVGGDHVTNDIALAFNIPARQAEALKRESGGAMVDPSARAQRLTLPPDVGFPERTITLHALQTVMNARLDETLTMIRSRIDPEIVSHIGAGVVLTGGGARCKDARLLAERIFGMPCSLGTARGVSGLATAISGPEYATAIGMVRYGFKTAARAEPNSLIGSWWQKMFGSRPPRFQGHEATE